MKTYVANLISCERFTWERRRTPNERNARGGVSLITPRDGQSQGFRQRILGSRLRPHKPWARNKGQPSTHSNQPRGTLPRHRGNGIPFTELEYCFYRTTVFGPLRELSTSGDSLQSFPSAKRWPPTMLTGTRPSNNPANKSPERYLGSNLASIQALMFPQL